MRTQGRGARPIAAVAAVAVGLTLATTAPSSAATATTPLLAGSAARASVKVSWQFMTDIDRRELVIEIDRGPDAAHFQVWGKFSRPRMAGYRLDRHPLAGKSVYRARILVNGVAGGWTNTVTMGASGSTPPPPPPPPPPSGACATARADVLKAVNAARAANNVGPLVDNTKLDTAAQVHSDWMANNNAFGHDNWVTEIQNAGYSGGTLGQNIAAGQTTTKDVMGAWMGSDGHRANILNPAYKDLGVGCTYRAGTTYGWYWTQDFGG